MFLRLAARSLRCRDSIWHSSYGQTLAVRAMQGFCVLVGILTALGLLRAAGGKGCAATDAATSVSCNQSLHPSQVGGIFPRQEQGARNVIGPVRLT
jgi:hypothetical protein